MTFIVVNRGTARSGFPLLSRSGWYPHLQKGLARLLDGLVVVVVVIGHIALLGGILIYIHYVITH